MNGHLVTQEGGLVPDCCKLFLSLVRHPWEGISTTNVKHCYSTITFQLL